MNEQQGLHGRRRAWVSRVRKVSMGLHCIEWMKSKDYMVDERAWVSRVRKVSMGLNCVEWTLATMKYRIELISNSNSLKVYDNAYHDNNSISLQKWYHVLHQVFLFKAQTGHQQREIRCSGESHDPSDLATTRASISKYSHYLSHPRLDYPYKKSERKRLHR